MKGLKNKINGRFEKNLEDIFCHSCKKLVKLRHAKQKFCSQKCKGAFTKKNHSRHCVVCNKMFSATSMKTKYCSHWCYGSTMVGKQKSGIHITPINSAIRTSTKYKLWVKECLKRDSYTCVICGVQGVQFNVDHIIPFSDVMNKLRFELGHENVYEKAMTYDLLWDLGNARTLCVDCHKSTDSYLKYKGKKYVI